MAGGMRRVIRTGGRAVFSVYHPAMSAAGKEAHFRSGDVEYRLGAVHHELAEYKAVFAAAGFVEIETSERAGDNELAAINPQWARYRGFPMLMLFRMTVPG